MRPIALTLPLLIASAATPASAHVSLQVPQAAPGSSYKAVFRVPHGCDGQATTAIRIRIPDGFLEAKPMPHPGWELGTKTGDYAKTYKLYGADVKSGVTEVDFTGGNLPDAWYDEFVVTGTIADGFTPGDVVFFPVVQECGAAAVTRWIEIPKAGEAIDDLKHPAPHVEVIARPQ
jgi:uncharacterized protein YcnI